MERGLAQHGLAAARQAADGGDDGVGIADRPPLLGGEEGHVRGDIELGARPDRLRRRLDVAHVAVRVPADVDGLDVLLAGFAWEHRLQANLGEGEGDAGGAQHQDPLDALPREIVGRDAGRGEHLVVVDIEADAAQLRGLFRRRKGAAVGEQHEGYGAGLQRRHHFQRARQHGVALARAVAEHEGAVHVEHEAPDRRGRGVGSITRHRRPFEVQG